MVFVLGYGLVHRALVSYTHTSCFSTLCGSHTCMPFSLSLSLSPSLSPSPTALVVKQGCLSVNLRTIQVPVGQVNGPMLQHGFCLVLWVAADAHAHLFRTLVRTCISGRLGQLAKIPIGSRGSSRWCIHSSQTQRFTRKALTLTVTPNRR